MPDGKTSFEELGANWNECKLCYEAYGFTWTREQLILWEEGVIWCPVRFVIEKESKGAAVRGLIDGPWKCRKAFWKTAYGKPDCDRWIDIAKSLH